jgi:hypothetical protein
MSVIRSEASGVLEAPFPTIISILIDEFGLTKRTRPAALYAAA